MAEDHMPVNDPLSETKSLITLLKSNNTDLQHNALKGLMFCPTVCVVNTFLEEGNLSFLVSLCGCPHKRVESAALRLLWHLSAQAELKVRLFEENVLDKIATLLQNDDQEVQLACSAILQNISEYRFEKGAINPNQVKIINCGILESLATRLTSADRRVQFLACLTLCNLSMNEENSRKIIKSNLLQLVRRFVERSQMHIDMVCHWITLQPHIPLLKSVHTEVQLFGLSCLLTLIRNDQYKVEVWKALSMNDGVSALFNLMQSEDTTISQLSTMITSMLQLEEPAVKETSHNVGLDLKVMCNNPEFSDVRFVCKGGNLFAHKAILASRCPQFHAMFTYFKESQQSEIQLQDIEYDTLLAVLEWLYTGCTAISRKNAVDVLITAEMYSLKELKEKCEVFLWHYIELDNVIQLYQTATLHHATQLERVCSQYITRNFSKLCTIETYQNLPNEVKTELQDLVKRSSIDSSGMCVYSTSTNSSDAVVRDVHEDAAAAGVVEAAV